MAEGRLPTFIIIGAMKGGTTTLHLVLRAHPEVFTSREKELEFFTKGYKLGRGLDWYRGHFRTDCPIRGETSPSYAAWPHHDGVPERMRDVIPDVQIIYCVRDPVERAISHYKHALARGDDLPPIDQGILREPFLRMGRYSTQLSRYLAAGFPMERIHVVQSEQLRARRAETTADVLRFLGAAPGASLGEPSREWHASDRKRLPTPRGRAVRHAIAPLMKRLPWRVRIPAERAILWPVSEPMPRLSLRPETRERLREAFATEVAELRERTGQAFEGWQV